MVNDRFGSVIDAGDIIAYPVTSGRSALIKIGKVLSVSVRTVKVVGIHDHWGCSGITLGKPAILNCPERAMVLPRELVPTGHLVLLDGYGNQG